jgi:phenylacetic acid degradation operon negative regulatory protein
MKPKSLILDLLSAAEPTPIPTGTFIKAARIFRLKENTVRVTLNRLVAGGTLEARGAGSERRHTLSPRSRVLNRHILATQTMRPHAWKGAWISVIAWAPGVERRGRDRFREALRVLKLANLQPGVWVRPDNLDLSLEEVLGEYGFKDEVIWTRGRLHNGRPNAALARSLYALARLSKAITRACRDLEASLARLETLSDERALAETFTVGGRAIKAMFEDPLLPPELLPPGWLGEELRKSFARYDRIGRAYWGQALGVTLGDRPAPAIGARVHSPAPLLARG